MLSIISKVRSLSASRMSNSVRQQKYFLIPLDEQKQLFFFKVRWTSCSWCHFASGIHEALRWLELTGVSYGVSIRP